MNRITIIIPAHRCPCGQIRRLLPQLGEHDRIVVVVNGFPRGISCTHSFAQSPAVQWLHATSALGPARARNLGAMKVAGSSAFLFCDADDGVSSCWVEQLSRPLLTGTAELVGGPLRVRGSKGQLTVVPPAINYRHSQALFGGNIGITSSAWRFLNGFNESLGCSEDTDLAWRAGARGMKIQVVMEAVVDVDFKPLIGEFRQRFQWGKGAVQLLRAHGMNLDLLPDFKTILDDKKTTGFARHPLTAALGEWAGQQFELIRKPSN